MTLRSSDLAEALKDLFEGAGGYPASDAEAGQRWAKAYRAYAGAAIAGPTAPLAASLQAAEAVLARALGDAFTAAKKAGTAGLATLTPLVDAAFVAFWLTPAVAFVTPPPPSPPAITGVVTVAVPGVLSAGLAGPLAAGAGPDATASQQAQDIAAVLDGWTRTVMVVNTSITPPAPPAPPVPLS
ncbi:MAG: hypothetical protein ACM3ML_08100 [Micromonosporaceae bacterium]